MSRNGLYTLTGVLATKVAAPGGEAIHDMSQQPRLAIDVDKSGIQVQRHD